MKNIYTKPWSQKEFIRFVSPSTFSLLSIALYMAVDAVFISRFAGTLAMASVNIIMPLYSFALGIGIMTASGASAIIGIELGKGKTKEANTHFSLVFAFLFMVAVGLIFAGYITGAERIAYAMGATPQLIPFCVPYLNIFLVGIGALVLQMFFEYTIRLDGRPSWALYVCLIGGGTNIILDYLLIVKFGMGIKGAAIASVSGIYLSCLIGMVYFCFQSNTLKPVCPEIDHRFLINSMVNGSSEMVNEFSAGVKTLVFNIVILKYAGEAGVAAVSILTYMFFLLSSTYIGLSMGVSPVISFNFGSRNFIKIRELVKLSIQFTFIAAISVFAFCQFFGDLVIILFAKGQDSVIAVAKSGMGIISFTFLLNGLNILGSAFFTSVNNGRISTLISVLRTFVFALGFIAVLPYFMNLNGIWLSLPAAEFATLIVTVYFIYKYRNVYLFPDRNAKRVINN